MDNWTDDSLYCFVRVRRYISPYSSKDSTYTVELDTSQGYDMVVNGVAMNKLELTICGEFEWAEFKQAMLAEFVGEKLNDQIDPS